MRLNRLSSQLTYELVKHRPANKCITLRSEVEAAYVANRLLKQLAQVGEHACISVKYGASEVRFGGVSLTIKF